MTFPVLLITFFQAPICELWSEKRKRRESATFTPSTALNKLQDRPRLHCVILTWATVRRCCRRSAGSACTSATPSGSVSPGTCLRSGTASRCHPAWISTRRTRRARCLPGSRARTAGVSPARSGATGRICTRQAPASTGTGYRRRATTWDRGSRRIPDTQPPITSDGARTVSEQKQLSG